MDHFIVSARKYRPQTFDTVVGQSHITTTLKNAIKGNQLAHAFLFCGPRGVGKTTCARILAKTINCENIQADGEACDVCTSCRTFNEGTSLNIHELDAASNNSVDDIRALVEQVRFPPQAGKYKVYIVDEVHMLSSSAFNAFLKTLEEPPSYAIFILATTEKHKILPTILSRCQIFDFKRITLNDTVNHLHSICVKETIDAEQPALQVIAQKSEGCMRDALSILDKIVSFTGGHLSYTNTLEHLNILDADYYFKLLDCMLTQNLSDALLLFDDINRKGFEGDLVLNGLAEFMRNVLVCKDDKIADLLDVVESFKTKYRAAAQKVQPGYCISALNILNEAELNYKGARNKRLHVELVLIKLTFLQQALELVENEGGIVKKKLTDIPVGFKTRPIIAARKITRTPPTTGNIPTASPASDPYTGPRLLIETPAAQPTARTAPTQPAPANSPIAHIRSAIPPTTPVSTGSAIGSLHKIREKIALQNANNNNTIRDLTMQLLQQAWNDFIFKLQEKKNHSAVTNFRLAHLRIADNNNFEIVTSSNIQQKFIDQERSSLIEHMQGVFNNRQLTYQVIVEETNVVQEIVEPQRNTRDIFQQMLDQYPLVQELKERLKLNLDY